MSVLLFIAAVAGTFAVAEDTSTAAPNTSSKTELKNYCPVCKQRANFKPFGFGEHKRPNARCPKCKTLERHRLLYLYLERNWADLFMNTSSLLHFAANDGLEGILRNVPRLRYVTADLFEPADLKLDLTAIDLPDESFDALICYHVLEHVENDKDAMTEMYRILKPDGWAIIQVPLLRDLPHTIDDPTIKTPKARTKHYGSPYHLRLYGWSDIKEQLENAGFKVTIEKIEYWVEPKFFEEYGLDKNEMILRCAKPAKQR